jgi:GT2 family glycosyltransferase
VKAAAVIVTCNRLGLLKQNLAAVRAQTRCPDEIIVVNNGSTDGTAEWLAAERGLTVVTQANSGSSGGQLTGIKTAWERGHDWIWCMDDDTIPSPTALEKMLASPLARKETTGFLCSVVRWKDGSIHLMNPPDLDRNYVKMMDLLPLGALKARTASFVSILVHRRAVAAKGLPLRDMFLWFDDAEYSLRITRSFDCYQILDSVVEHRTEVNSFVDFENMAGTPKGKLRYGLRNFIFLRKWQAPSATVGWARAIKSALRMQLRICRQFSVGDYWELSTAAWSGIFFSPKIEFPGDARVASPK